MESELNYPKRLSMGGRGTTSMEKEKEQTPQQAPQAWGTSTRKKKIAITFSFENQRGLT